MPADRSKSKKASSSRHVLPYTDRNNNYAVNPLAARAIRFAPNVTPGTYLETEAGAGLLREHASPRDALLPAVETTAPTPSRRREPRGKSRSQDHIPRPPNAFILFRSAFAKSEHLPELAKQGNVSLSKILGDCWHDLVPEEKQKWEEKARVEKEQHSRKYPGYVFRPVHKEKKAGKRKAKAGNELVGAVSRDTEQQPTALTTPEFFSGVDQWVPSTSVYQPAPYYGGHRPISSAPTPSHLYNPNRLPTLPSFLSQPLTDPSCTPPRVGNISRTARNLAARRASSLQPTLGLSSTYPMEMRLPIHMPVPALMPPTWQRNWPPVPELDTSLFELAVQGGSPFLQAPQDYQAFPACALAQRQLLSLEIDPLDCGALGIEGYSDVPPFAFSSAQTPLSAFPYHAPFAHGPMPNTADTDSSNGWTPASGSTSGISASPPPSENTLAYALNAGLLAHQLEMQTQEQPFDGYMYQGPMVEPPHQQYDLGGENDLGAQLQLQQYAQVGDAVPAYLPVVQPSELQEYASMGLPVDDYTRVQMGEPSRSGSRSQQGWYPNEERGTTREGLMRGSSPRTYSVSGTARRRTATRRGL